MWTCTHLMMMAMMVDGTIYGDDDDTGSQFVGRKHCLYWSFLGCNEHKGVRPLGALQHLWVQSCSVFYIFKQFCRSSGSPIHCATEGDTSRFAASCPPWGLKMPPTGHYVSLAAFQAQKGALLHIGDWMDHIPTLGVGEMEEIMFGEDPP